MIDKTGATLLAVGQEIEADLLLGAHVESRGIVLGLFLSSAVKAKRHSTAVCSGEPVWTRKTADGRCSDGRKLHNITSKDFSLPIYAPEQKDKALTAG